MGWLRNPSLKASDFPNLVVSPEDNVVALHQWVVSVTPLKVGT
jgi:hypothetical protein